MFGIKWVNIKHLKQCLKYLKLSLNGSSPKQLKNQGGYPNFEFIISVEFEEYLYQYDVNNSVWEKNEQENGKPVRNLKQLLS